MRAYKKEKILILLEYSLIFLICILFILLFIKAIKYEDAPQEALYGVPLIYENEDSLEMHSIDQVVDDGTRLYILFNDHEGIVQIYDIDGNYEKTVEFYGGNNGAFKIAAENGIFYVCDKKANLYLFSDGEFVDFLTNSEGMSLRKSINFEDSSPNFRVHLGSVWRIDNGEEICVIRRPISSALFQGNFVLILGFAIIFFGGIIRKNRHLN